MAIPNLHQMAKSNLIQVKKNKTIKWLTSQTPDEQHNIVELARKSRNEVREDYKHAAEDRQKLRQEKMIKEKARRDALQRRAAEEKAKLSTVYVITSIEELKCALANIDDENISATKKNQKKRSFLREQINARKKVLNETVNIPFTRMRKQRPLVDIIREFSALLESEGCTSEVNNHVHHNFTSESLVGRKILQRFEVHNEEKWFSGFIVAYNAQTRLHEITYDGEEEHCFFNLLQDLSKGDLVVQTD